MRGIPKEDDRTIYCPRFRVGCNKSESARWLEHYKINDGGGPDIVKANSPRILRRMVWLMARQFRLEFRYDFVQYGHDGEDEDEKGVAFLWSSTSRQDYDWRFAFGACCFRWREWDNAPHGWALQWIWFHPSERRAGHLTSAWPNFRARFGDFFVEPPLSDGMKAFLVKCDDGRGDERRCVR